MRFVIKHEINGRIRVHLIQKTMSFQQADTLLYYLHSKKFVTYVKVYERTADVTIGYVGARSTIIAMLRQFQYENVIVPSGVLATSGRELNAQYQEKLMRKVFVRIGGKFLLPPPIRTVYIVLKAGKYIFRGLKSLIHWKIEVAVLDATAIGVSVLRNDISTASSIMFLLGIGELLEEWTHKKSVDDLARSMSLNVKRVWLVRGDQEILVLPDQIKVNDCVVVHMGNVIPFDGVVVSGEAMVNQASLTGESVPIRKVEGGYVYAGTVLEEGELTIEVKAVGNSTKFEKIVAMIEESEKLKSKLEGKAEHLADKLVPYTLAGTALTYLCTRSITKALSVLMVDFSCALKLAMPIAVLSAIREASLYDITVKGGKYLEAVAEATTIVFDKTGTLTKAKPTVIDVISFNNENEDELLRVAACLEEHFPHSMAKAVVDAARKKGLEHKEMHSKVDYIVAHGISSFINNKKVVIGSYHFIFEDENCKIPDGCEAKFASLSDEYSYLYLAIEQELAAVICIEDPLREEAAAVINSLRQTGIDNVVMMTGDSEKTAKAIARKVGVDKYYSEVLPEDKANFIEHEKARGRKVIMIGDGINDSPALSAADVGIAISDGAELAREIADITIAADNLFEIVTLKLISNGLMKRIGKNYRLIVGFNTVLILCGVGGIIQPTTSALLHNTSTLAISLKSMQNLLT
ncbi:heavy metal translocating P-type ATPase [Velocimicrobium porci]|uniref:Cd(2+)-exporting ATPase n=1 Tax=Velocimicrobium porci TaxID=2606634 RepID=A0A6L5XXY8_9FIRM|nr:heavy metal translocating P-type ATPase [Velocimicrobium porci]MSS63645.1 heavy metal translocating P-type ATPase [Velocimicrobium porci]